MSFSSLGPKPSNQILPREKRVNRDILAPQTYKTELIGFLVMNKLSIYGSLSIYLNFFAHIFPKMACFCKFFRPPKLFTPTGQFLYMDISVISMTFCNYVLDSVTLQALNWFFLFLSEHSTDTYCLNFRLKVAIFFCTANS